MKFFFSLGAWIILVFVLLILLSFFKNNPEWVEYYYTTIFYTHTSQILRLTFGAIPFSVGDILYGLVIIFLIVKIFKLFKNKYGFKHLLLQLVLFIAKTTLIFFIVFNVLWGFNNYRIPLNQQLNIDTQYTQDELLNITERLIEKANRLQLQINSDSTKPVKINYTTQKILSDAEKGIKQLNTDLNWKEFKNTSIKKSLLSSPLTYMGFSGYLNPFTNEAQVNYKIPKLGMIITATHETAHQMGVAKESDANLIGYLGALKQQDIVYQYAATIYALRFCLSTLERNSNSNLNEFTSKISEGVLFNLNESQVFWSQYKGLSSMFFKMFYGNFLKATNQKEGIYSYNRFVDLLINYHKTVSL